MFATACVGSQSQVCLDGTVCPSATTCVLGPQEQWTCASEDQFTACTAPHVDGDDCVFGSTQGKCFGGVCIPSDLRCGNEIVDAVRNEECDDGNVLTHDGCSDTCELEVRQWRITPVDQFPDAASSMVYDSHRNRIVLFGGRKRSTWEWDGISWQAASPVLSPTPRNNFGMAYDSKRRRVVLFGGNALFEPIDETWEWDGTNWTLVTSPSPPPAARSYPMMAYDPVRGRVVMFGGTTNRRLLEDSQPNVFDDFWEWDGANWTELSGPRPGARAAATMTYDPKRGVMVLFGGVISPATFLDDTWELTTNGWVERLPATRPPARARAGAAFDPVSGRVLLHGGGRQLGIEFGDQWMYDGVDWSRQLPDADAGVESPICAFAREGYLLRVDSSSATRLWNGSGWSVRVQGSPGLSPLPRSSHAGAADFEGRRILIHGGVELTTGPAVVDDTLLWDGARWSRPGGTQPSPRRDAAMAYDAERREFVLFGGLDTNIVNRDDTWVHDGTKWTQRGPPSMPMTPQPTGRNGHVMVYDSARKRVVMHGGRFDPQTWEWDGAQWTVVSALGPPPLELAAAGYDPVAKKVVLFGGRETAGTTSVHKKTWTYDGTAWSEEPVPNGPQARIGAAIAWNAPHRALTMFGGLTTGSTIDDAWEWVETNGRYDWRFVAVAGPGRRMNHSLFPLFDGTGVVTFGGRENTPDGAPAFDEFVQLISRSNAIDESCGRDDLDADGRFRCDDPDCWTVCNPTCPPDVSCDLAEPHCGDSSCDSRESCETCPTDCGPCTPKCGDGTVDGGEDRTTCPGDFCIVLGNC